MSINRMPLRLMVIPITKNKLPDKSVFSEDFLMASEPNISGYMAKMI